MLKEVGRSGQISLGKKYAGSLFEVVAHPNDRFELLPMKAVPAHTPEQTKPASLRTKKGWLPPGGYTQANAWALENRAALEDYAARIATYGTAADELEQYLASESAAS